MPGDRLADVVEDAGPLLGACLLVATESWATSLAERGRIVTADTAEQLRERLVDDWQEAREHGADAVMLAHRRSDVADLNRRARERVREAGHLCGDDLEIGERAYAQGDQVVCRRNQPSLGVVNGDRGTLVALGADALRVRLDDDRDVELPTAYAAEHLDHGYAITAHRAQGATYDRTFVLGSDELSRQWGYTAMTRHRDEARFYVTAPRAFLNQPARPLAEQGEIVEAVGRLFESSAAQQRALDLLEQHPHADHFLRRLDASAADRDRRSNAPEELAAERDTTSVIRLRRRRELDNDLEAASRLQDEAQSRLDDLLDRFNALDETDDLDVPLVAREPSICDPPDIAPGHDPSDDLDMGW